MKKKKIQNWKKRNRAYSLKGIGVPLSCGASRHTTHQDTPISVSSYGTFSEHMLRWIDEQEVPPWYSTDFQTQEVFRALAILPNARESIQAKVKKKERSLIIKARRSRFTGKRDQYMLAMLHAGKPYICSSPLCGEMRSLAIDHIIPLSKGGGDDLDNFQFLCQKHNSAKGSKFQT